MDWRAARKGIAQAIKDILSDQEKDLLKEQFNLRMQKAIGQAARSDQFTKVRRNIARVKTVMTEKRNSGE